MEFEWGTLALLILPLLIGTMLALFRVEFPGSKSE
jgi:hypothetical protein